ncbi:MAG: PaaI family thioesterase [Balneolaceae bacterium]
MMKTDMEIEESIRKQAESLMAGKPTMADAIGIEFQLLSRDQVVATLPVTDRTVQPMRILHGGATVALAESVMSVGALLHLDSDDLTAVGLEINANHLKTVKEGGQITASAEPIHIGRKIHVWQTRITDQDGRLISISRCTLAIIPTER